MATVTSAPSAGQGTAEWRTVTPKTALSPGLPRGVSICYCEGKCQRLPSGRVTYFMNTIAPLACHRAILLMATGGSISAHRCRK